jgi:chorismate mutase
VQYTKLIKEGNTAGIMELLTNAVVEEKVLQRVRNKACAYGQEVQAGTGTPQAAAVKVLRIAPLLVLMHPLLHYPLLRYITSTHVCTTSSFAAKPAIIIPTT